jgi:uncharacterized damage-inducible protein DinB
MTGPGAKPLEAMVRQMHWANAQLIEWLNPDGPQGNFRDREYFIGLTSHILRAERAWLDRAYGRDWDRNMFVHLFHNSMSPINDACRDGWLALLATGLESREIDYVMMDGTPRRTAPHDMILHVFSHGFHHRGQMAARASTLGLKLPNLAYIQFTRTVL